MALTLALACVTPLARAGTITYTYTGNPFTSFGNAYVCQAGFGPCAVAGTVTLAAALGNSFSGIVTPVSYSFTDGTATFDNTNSTAYGGGAIVPANLGFGFTTDATGAITGWYFNLLLNANSSWNMQSSLAGGNSLDLAQNGLIGPAEVSNDPGTWTTPEATPEPATWTLFGAGALLLVALAGADRRRRGARGGAAASA